MVKDKASATLVQRNGKNLKKPQKSNRGGILFQDGQTGNRCCVYRTEHSIFTHGHTVSTTHRLYTGTVYEEYDRRPGDTNRPELHDFDIIFMKMTDYTNTSCTRQEKMCGNLGQPA